MRFSYTHYTIRTIDSLRETLQKGALLDTAIALTAADFDRRTNYKEAMTTPELQHFIAQERMKGAPFVEFYEVELYRPSLTRPFRAPSLLWRL